MSLKPDDLLLNGQYRILRQLGRGGFGFVYQAHDTLLGEQVAIKELIPALVGDETMLKRFLGEAKATMRLANPHIVRTHNVFSERDNYYIVMECMAGGSLEDRLQKQGALPVEEALRITADVCQGLGHAHQQGLVHCDLKPANILFSANGTAKVADFGIAYMPEHLFTRTWRTQAGFAAGTLPYMSPEQTSGVRDDPRVDVYALGAVLSRMLTGRTYLDFDESETPVAHANNVNQIHHQQPELPSVLNPRVPDWLDAVVLKTLAKEPEQRYANASALGHALTERAPVDTSPQPVPLPVPVLLDETKLLPRDQKALPPQPATEKSGPPGWLLPVAGVAALLLVVILVGLVIFLAVGARDDSTVTPTGVRVALAATTATAGTGATSVDSTPTTYPESSATLVSTGTLDPIPTDTVGPRDTPRPAATDTARPTDTPLPTRTPVPAVTDTARPSDTPAPTDTAAPSATAISTLTPSPTVEIPPLAVSVVRAGRNDFDLYLLDEQGNVQVPIASVEGWNEFQADWSPDGWHLGFIRGELEVTDAAVRLLETNAIADVDPANPEPLLTRLEACEYGRFFSWSPDGKNIVCNMPQDPSLPWNERVFDIWKFDLASGEGTQLTNHHLEDQQPSWSPDGKQIAFGTNRGSSWEIYVMNADGSNMHPLTVRTQDRNPAWSPDGKHIAFVSHRDGNYEIYTMNPDGTGQTRLTSHPANDIDVGWTPDGRILFISDRDGDSEVFVMNRDGTDLTQLTHNDYQDRWPKWRP